MKNQPPPQCSTSKSGNVRTRSSGPIVLSWLLLLLSLAVPNATAMRIHPTSTTYSAHTQRQLQDVILFSLGDDAVQNEDEDDSNNLTSERPTTSETENIFGEQRTTLEVASDPSEHEVTI
jgi:hypothetical protein